PAALRHADPREKASCLAATVPRFSAIALIAVAMLVASGTYLAILQVTAWPALFRSTYGRVVLAKIGGLSLALVLGAFNLLRTRRKSDEYRRHPGRIPYRVDQPRVPGGAHGVRHRAGSAGGRLELCGGAWVARVASLEPCCGLHRVGGVLPVHGHDRSCRGVRVQGEPDVLERGGGVLGRPAGSGPQCEPTGGLPPREERQRNGVPAARPSALRLRRCNAGCLAWRRLLGGRRGRRDLQLWLGGLSWRPQRIGLLPEAHRGHGSILDRQGLLARRERWRGGPLRRRRVLRPVGLAEAEQAGRGHGCHAKRQGVLACGGGRR